MDITKARIVSDSSSDVMKLDGVSFISAPLKIITDEKQYADDASLDVEAMVDDLLAYNGRSSTSCPNAEDWLGAFSDAEAVFCVTITGTLSGSHNAAMTAKRIYEEEHPERRVFVLDSLSAGPEVALILDKLRELLLSGKEFDEICAEITSYTKKTGLLFMLESMKNLANNGRVNPIVAKVVGLLDIRVVGKASDKGDLEPLSKCRGEKKALESIVRHLKELGLKTGRVKIAHCFNEKAGSALRELIHKELGQINVELYKCRGLCSFYAEKGGMLIGFEKT